jgi:bla regulator protein BlaR1
MTWLVAIGVANACWACPLALLAWGVGRFGRCPAASRLLWVLVLCKLLMPPVYQPAVGDWLSVPRRWLAETSAMTSASPSLDSDRAEAAGFLLRDGAGSNLATRKPLTAAAEEFRLSSKAGAARKVRSPSPLLLALAKVSSGTWLRSAATVWVGGSAACAIWLALRTWRFRRFLVRAAHADAELTCRVAQLADRAGLTSAPRVMVLDSAVSPMLWGAGRRSWLLFPSELRRRIDPAGCDALLLHELAHYARRDGLVRLLELAALVVYWWHPLVWWARRGIEAAEEECCDAWVLNHQAASRRVYAEALLATLDFLCEPVRPLPPAACGLGAANLLRSRLTQIMCGNVATSPSRAARSLVLAGAVLALPFSPALIGPTQREAAAVSLPSATPRADGRASAGLDKVEPASTAPATETAMVDVAKPSPVEPKPGSWFVARQPAARPAAVLYATAVSPNGRYKLEARTGRRTTLVDVLLEKRLDLSSYRILAASFSPNSRMLATAQDDESVVRLWDCTTGGMLSLLKGSDAVITSVAFAGDARRVAAGAADGSVLVWNVGEEDVAARMPHGDAPVSCLRWSERGDRLAIAMSDWSNRDVSSLVVWQPGAATVGESISLAHSTGALDWLNEDELFVADWNGEARVIALGSGMPVESLWLGKDSVSAAAFSPDCRLLPLWQARVDGGDTKPEAAP